MISKLDKLWFRLLGRAHVWMVRRGQAYCRREVRRRFWRQLARQKTHVN